MKIIATDNYDRDYISDELIAFNLSKKEAKRKADKMNKKTGEHSPIFYRIVPNDYKLHIFEP